MNDELSFDDMDADVNSYLVAVVGGRVRVNSISRSNSELLQRQGPRKDRNSFVRRIAEYETEIKTSLKFKDGEEFKKNITEDKFVEETQLFYIAQGEREAAERTGMVIKFESKKS